MKVLVCCGFVLAIAHLTGAVVCADDVAELRERAVAMRREAAELLANGHDEESNRLTKESMMLLETARHLAEVESVKPEKHHPDVLAMKERLRDLHATLEKARETGAPEVELKELEEQVQQTKKKLAQVLENLNSKHHAELDRPELRKKLELVHRRIEHLHVAAENLKAAEMHDLAIEVMKKTEGLEKELRRAQADIQRDEPPRHGDLERELRALREENERLRNTVKELTPKQD